MTNDYDIVPTLVGCVLNRRYCMVCVYIQRIINELKRDRRLTIHLLAYCTDMHLLFVHCKIFHVK